MGSFVEINDTLEITAEQGFPAELLDIQKHREKPITLADVEGKVFSFKNKPAARIYQLDPVRVFYVHNIDGKWLFWGHVFIQSQTVTKVLDADGNWNGKWQTAGTYIITQLYDPQYQETFTRAEAPPDRNYFIPSSSEQSS